MQKKLSLYNPDIIKLETKQLIHRQWQGEDYEPFARLNNNIDVMEYFPNTLSRMESEILAENIMGFISENGWGMWAVEIKSTGEFSCLWA